MFADLVGISIILLAGIYVVMFLLWSMQIWSAWDDAKYWSTWTRNNPGSCYGCHLRRVAIRCGHSQRESKIDFHTYKDNCIKGGRQC